MQFKVYNSENTPHLGVRKSSGHVRMRFQRNGKITLSRKLVSLVNARKGILLLEDKQYPGDFYITSEESSHSYKLHGPNKRGEMYIECDTLVGVLGSKLGMKAPYSIDVDDTPVVSDGVTVYALRMKQAKQIIRKDLK